MVSANEEIEVSIREKESQDNNDGLSDGFLDVMTSDGSSIQLDKIETSNPNDTAERKKSIGARNLTSGSKKSRQKTEVSSQLVWMHGFDFDKKKPFKKSGATKGSISLSEQLDWQSYSSRDDTENGAKHMQSHSSVSRISKTRLVKMMSYESDEEASSPGQVSVSVQKTKETSEHPQTLAQTLLRMIFFTDASSESVSTQDSDSDKADENLLANYNKRQRKKRLKIGAAIFFVLLCLALVAYGFLERKFETPSIVNNNRGALNSTPTMAPTDNLVGTGSPTVAKTDPALFLTLSPTQTRTTAYPTISATTYPTEIPSILPSPGPTTTPSLHPSSLPTKVPTPSPTSDPTSPPTNHPTAYPAPAPTNEPSPGPTLAPTPVPTPEPTALPSLYPTPSPTDEPTRKPAPSPTPEPTIQPTPSPTSGPTFEPTPPPTKLPTVPLALVGRSYIIGDLPYTEEEKDRLILHVNSLPDDAEFLVHVGDIRNAEDKSDCKMSEFKMVAEILKQSPVPVFIVPGDNEYNDCPNLDESWGDWLSEFADFEKHWDSSLKVNRAPGRPESFYFVHKRMLYIGLNIVGGERTDYAEWESRLSEQWTWTKSLIETHVLSEPYDASGVVIIGHADPRPQVHATFFEPLRDYIADELNNEIPILYVNGDLHYFQFDDNFYGQSNFQRIMVEGGSKQPPLKLSVKVPDTSNHDTLKAGGVFAYDRYPFLVFPHDWRPTYGHVSQRTRNAMVTDISVVISPSQLLNKKVILSHQGIRTSAAAMIIRSSEVHPNKGAAAQ
eukprot:scaffold1599_cov115-Cylindrotheca_fusiformis.AAC.3